MYYQLSLTADHSELRRIKVGLVDTRSNQVFYYEDGGLHEILAREICQDRGYDWRIYGNVSAVDYLLERAEFLKLSNYGEGVSYRYLGAEKKAMRRSKPVREWLWLLCNRLMIRPDIY